MTARVPFTQIQIEKAMRAAKKEGCAVELVLPNGARLVVHNGPLSIAPATSQSKEVDTWADR